MHMSIYVGVYEHVRAIRPWADGSGAQEGGGSEVLVPAVHTCICLNMWVFMNMFTHMFVRNRQVHMCIYIYIGAQEGGGSEVLVPALPLRKIM